MAIIPIAKMVSVIAMIQSVSPIDKAATYQTRLFTMYIVFLVVSGLLAVLFTVFVYRAGNGYQNALKADADARIAEARRGAAEAQEKAGDALRDAGLANESASKANTQAQKLEQQNLQLRTDLESATAESRAKQAELTREQSRLAEEQRKTAEAQRKAAEAQLALKKHLEEVAERQKPRHLTSEQKSELVRLLRLIPKGPISFESIDGEPETYAFAAELSDAFIEAGWNASIMRINSIIPPPIGLHILVRSRRAVPPHGNPVARALMAIGLELAPREDPIVPEGEIILQVGSKE